MKRGEIYYIKNDSPRIGHEIMKDRPAVIVSNDGYNAKSGMLTVVYLTRTPREDLLSHVTIRSTGRTSEALCEQITAVSASRVGRYMGTVTDDEMRRIEAGIQIHLAMSMMESEPERALERAEGLTVEEVTKIREEAKRDTVQRVFQILENMSYGAKQSARQLEV